MKVIKMGDDSCYLSVLDLLKEAISDIEKSEIKPKKAVILLASDGSFSDLERRAAGFNYNSELVSILEIAKNFCLVEDITE